MTSAELIDRCRAILEERWATAISSSSPSSAAQLPAALLEDIAASVNSKTLTFRYVLPTQVLAKLADPDLDCRCVQAKRGGRGAFDARSVAHEVIVPFDRANHNVLGGSSEPYVNKPLRCEEVTPAYRKDKRDGDGWDALCRVLESVERTSDDSHTVEVFEAVMVAVADRLQDVHITYAVPNRIGLEGAQALIAAFLNHRTGGSRFQSLLTALFETLGSRFGLYTSVRRSAVNSADSQSGAVADIDCFDADGRVVTAVEAKDRSVTIRHVQDKLPALRERGVREAFFISTLGREPQDADDLNLLIRHEFGAGQNIYVLDSEPFFGVALSLLGEDGRREFLRKTGTQLDQYGSLTDRQEWASLLKES